MKMPSVSQRLSKQIKCPPAICLQFQHTAVSLPNVHGLYKAQATVKMPAARCGNEQIVGPRGSKQAFRENTLKYSDN